MLNTNFYKQTKKAYANITPHWQFIIQNGSIDPILFGNGGRLITMLANIVLRDHDQASSCIKPNRLLRFM